MKPLGPRIGVLMFLLGWMVFVFAIVPFVYGITQLRTTSLAIAVVGAVIMATGGFWAWKSREGR